MKATFVEMTIFAKHRAEYLSDDDFRDLQQELLSNPRKGDTISGTGGLRKIRWSDSSRNKGKRGGTRIIYYFYDEGCQFWLFLIYNKDEMQDLSREQKKIFRDALNAEKQARQRS
jgi:mRNA-degrading endonuclease RelE of RelBE toxin-antitoxin system